MKHQIQNDFFKVAINAVGAELCSFKSIITEKEYIWPAKKEVWGSSSPVLFPIVGGLKNNSFLYEGKTYELPRHGFIRGCDTLEVEKLSPKSIAFSLKANKETLKIYPFQFSFTIAFELIDKKLVVSYLINNDGDKSMYFSLGAHPAFNCPWEKATNINDYYIEFEKEENERSWDLDSAGLIADQGALLLDNTRVLPLHKHLFDKDALIFKSLKSRKLSLKSRKSSTVIRLHFSDFPSLGIWAKPQSDFVCLEPWLGYADSVNTKGLIKEKEGILSLSPQEEFKASYSIEITDI
ncbi:MAG: aldose epimerase [Bacteroidetes bacterium 4572_77]|nr:MAG: aldose epimerase [Bacteroidetes bacterium 4572_77]